MLSRRPHGPGLGLRGAFAEELGELSQPGPDWLEIVPESWLNFGGWRRKALDRCMERWPTIPHSVSLNLGGPDPLDGALLSALRSLCRRSGAPFFSDHLCYSSLGGVALNDLLPLPFSEEAAAHFARRVRQAQDAVELPLLVENITYYARMPGSEMDEVDFLLSVLDQSGCGLLLDVNNIYVNALNHGGNPRQVLDRLPMDRVQQIHVAGHSAHGDVVIDTHIGPIIDEVWALYRYTLQRAGRMIPTLIEWDQDLPPLPTLLQEVERARTEAAEALRT